MNADASPPLAAGAPSKGWSWANLVSLATLLSDLDFAVRTSVDGLLAV